MFDLLLQWWQTSLEMPIDQLASTIVFWLSPFVIFAVLIWGFLELWILHRQTKYDENLKYYVLQISVPKDAIQTPKGIENFFSMLIGAKSNPTFYEAWIDGKFFTTMSFEIASLEGKVGFYARVQTKYRDILEAALYAEYPEAQIIEVEDYAEKLNAEYPSDEWDMWGSEVITKKPDYFPIKTYIDFEHQGEKDQRFKDPLLGIIEAMGKMGEGEYMCFQLLITPTGNDDWVKEGQKFIDKTFGKPEKSAPKGFFSQTIGWIPSTLLEQTFGMVFGGGDDEPKQDDFRAFKITPFEKEQIEAVNRKIGKIGWKSKIRFMYIARKDRFRKGPMASTLKGLFQQYTHQGLNKLGLTSVTPKDDYPWQLWEMPTKQRNLVNRYRSRSNSSGASAKIMNVEELATLWHFPTADAITPVLTSIEARRAEAPVELNFAGAEVPMMQNMQRGDDFSPANNSSLPPRKPLSVPRVSIPGTNSQPRGADPAFPNMVPVKPQDLQPAQKNESQNTIDSEEEIKMPVLKEREDDLQFMPKPGMPAPLPPGLDLKPVKLSDEKSDK